MTATLQCQKETAQIKGEVKRQVVLHKKSTKAGFG